MDFLLDSSIFIQYQFRYMSKNISQGHVSIYFIIIHDLYD
jgi:hypothetical protein